MQTLSSASRTCIASASAVECTATVAMPSSLQARSTRSAISPRLAIRILSNICTDSLRRHPEVRAKRASKDGEPPPFEARPSAERPRVTARLLNNHQRLAVLDRMAVLEQDLRHLAGARRGDLVHGLHRFDDQQRIAGPYHTADVDERLGGGFRRAECSADHWRSDNARMFRRIDDLQRDHRWRRSN